MSADSIRRTRKNQPERVFYRQRGIAVTSRHLTVGPDRYELAELDEIMQGRGTRHPGLRVGGLVAVAEAAIIAPLVGVVHQAALWLIAAVALVVPVAAGLVCAARWPAEYRLIGRYRGYEMTLFITRDEREFGQVTRALRRAVESAP